MRELTEIIRKKTEIIGINDLRVKEARDMLAAKFKGDGRLFICEGLWAADKLISKNIAVRSVFFHQDHFISEEKCSDEEFRQLGNICAAARNVYSISAKACAKISDREGSDNCFIIAEMPENYPENLELRDNMLIMILDGQEQPGNIGAILRSLDAAGGDFAIATNRRVKLTHPRLIRSSLGSAFMMPFFEMSFGDAADWLVRNRFRIVLTDLTANKNFCDIPAEGRVAVVAGNEHTGISPAWRDIKGAEPVIIPMLGSVESLNVGFASTLVAYNIGLRQRGLM